MSALWEKFVDTEGITSQKKRTNNDPQNSTQKIKNSATQTH
jgi:hypothetical protein